jgi:hypothetical protein
MVCFRSRRLVAGFFICSAVLGACGGKKDEGKPAADHGGGGSVAGNKDLDMIPAESEVVLGVALAQAQQSALFRDLVLPMVTKSGDIQRFIETIKSKCNIDPLTAATGMTAGIKDAGSRNPDVVAVLHGIEKAKALPCVDQVKDELAAQRLEVTRDGDVVLLTSERGNLAFTFTGDATAVVVAGPRATKERVLEVAQGKSTLRSSKEFADMYSRVQTTHTVWTLVNGHTPLVARNLENLGAKSKAILGSANITEKLEINGRIRVESEDQAKTLAEKMTSLAGYIGKAAEKLEIEPDKTDVRFAFVFTQQQLKTILSVVLPFISGSR